MKNEEVLVREACLHLEKALRLFREAEESRTKGKNSVGLLKGLIREIGESVKVTQHYLLQNQVYGTN